jgi:HD superfamily phosphohydrolase
LQGLVSGSLDLDKIEYLKRDALMCGVPYGEIDVDRLLNSLVLRRRAATGRRVVGVLEKGLSALESLLFAKYQMYRNVYWHHAVRSATAMYKRLVDEALTAGDVTRGR